MVTAVLQTGHCCSGETLSYLTEYLGQGKSEPGESDGSIIGTGELDVDTSGESGPSVAELGLESRSGD